MITIAQCRGARGLLGWTQQDLADASGLSKTAINNFEKGHSDIKAESLRAIRMAFESADIEFMDQSGLRQKSETMRLLKGTKALDDLFHDMCDTLSRRAGDILLCHMDPALPAHLSPLRLSAYTDLVKKHHLRQRILSTKPPAPLLEAQHEYRTLPAGAEGSAPTTVIYGPKLAFILHDHTTVLLIESLQALQAETRRFEMLWSQATPLKKPTREDLAKQQTS